MMTTKAQFLTPRSREILALVVAAEHGVKAQDLCSMAGVTYDVMWKHLRRLREAGLVVSVGRSIACRWCTVERRAAVAAIVAEQVRRRAKETKARTAAARNKRRKEARAEAAAREAAGFERDDEPIVQSVVSTWAPPVKTAPASVFELGAMA